MKFFTFDSNQSLFEKIGKLCKKRKKEGALKEQNELLRKETVTNIDENFTFF